METQPKDSASASELNAIASASNSSVEAKETSEGIQSIHQDEPKETTMTVCPVLSFTAKRAEVTGMTVGKRGEYILANYKEDLVLLFNREGRFCRRLRLPSDVLDVATSLEGNNVVANGSNGIVICIAGVNYRTEILHRFGNKIIESCTSVAVNSKGQIIVADKQKAKIYFLSAPPNIHVINTIYKTDSSENHFHQPAYIAVNRVNDDVIVTDIARDRKCIKIFSKDGEFRAESKTTFESPKGICVHEGRIFVLDKGSVIVLSSRGDMILSLPLEALGRFDPPPHLLHVNNKGQLVVGNSAGSVRVYQYTIM